MSKVEAKNAKKYYSLRSKLFFLKGKQDEVFVKSISENEQDRGTIKSAFIELKKAAIENGIDFHDEERSVNKLIELVESHLNSLEVGDAIIEYGLEKRWRENSQRLNKKRLELFGDKDGSNKIIYESNENCKFILLSDFFNLPKSERAEFYSSNELLFVNLNQQNGRHFYMELDEFSHYFKKENVIGKIRGGCIEKEIQFFNFYHENHWEYYLKLHFWGEEYCGPGKDGPIIDIITYFNLKTRTIEEEKRFEELYQQYKAPYEKQDVTTMLHYNRITYLNCEKTDELIRLNQ